MMLDIETVPEQPFFFPNGEYNLFGILHKPMQEIKGGFVFCHPFAEEKLWTHRVYVNFARELAKRGYAVLRFDYMGHGDSDGDFSDSNLETRLSDINCAIDTLIKKVSGTNNIGLLGMRYGALLAGLIAEQRDDLTQLILWEPVIKGDRYMQEILRSNLSTQLAVYGKVTKDRAALVQDMRDGITVNYEGYDLTLELFEQSSAVDLLSEDKSFPGKTLVVQIGKQGQPIAKPLESLAGKYKNSVLEHVSEEPFWREGKKYYSKAPELYKTTLEWAGV